MIRRTGKYNATAADVDLLIIGAGPAGAMLGFLAARLGLHTLLVEKHSFPRPKVCGGCLSARAVSLLREVGLQSLVQRFADFPLRSFHVQHVREASSAWLPGVGTQSLSLPLPGGLAISRADFDDALVKYAIDEGCRVVEGTTATVQTAAIHEPCRQVLLRRAGEPDCMVRAAVVVIASGLSHACLEHSDELPGKIGTRARIGFSGIIPARQFLLPIGELRMIIDRHAYVGAVRISEHCVNVAGAADPGHVRGHDAIATCVDAHLCQVASYEAGAARAVTWRGTELLSREYGKNAAHRLFAIGDAAGYVEPFTGEGMAWAIASAIRVLPWVDRSAMKWESRLADQWNCITRREWDRQKRICRVLTSLVRVPWAVDVSLLALRCFPQWTRRIANRVTAGGRS